jgi:RNA polymerase sigma factor (TIGR02999 family)
MPSDFAALLDAAHAGRPGASQELFAALYTQLHHLASRQLARGAHGGLGATTLVHEAYLAIGARPAPSFTDEGRFVGYVARVMRGLVIDHLRSRHAQKRGGHFKVTSLDTEVPDPGAEAEDLERLGAAVDQLAHLEPALAEVVDLKFFCGFSFAEIAAMRAVSERTVQRNWEKARLYLHRQLSEALAA